jgi:hypothetical protein
MGWSIQHVFVSDTYPGRYLIHYVLAALRGANWELCPSEMPLIPNPSTLDRQWKTYMMQVLIHVPILYSLWFDQEEGYIYKRTTGRALK